MRYLRGENERYYPISRYYRELFGEKVYKIPVTVSYRCPPVVSGAHRCIYCDPWGSAARPDLMSHQLRDQIEVQREIIERRFRSKRFLIYFQSYTSTLQSTQNLREIFEEALSMEGVVGLIVGTRPDCLSQALVALLEEFSKRTFVGVELGVQTLFEDDLKFLRRGHDVASALRAIEQVGATGINLGVHLILGLPNETYERLIEMAQRISILPIHNVKLHHLHVIRGTPLEELYRSGDYEPMTLEEYSRRVILFLRHLSCDVAVHRLSAVVAQWDQLVAPDWTRHRLKSHQYIVDDMVRQNAQQGDYRC